MIDEHKTKEKLISEFKELRKQVFELEVSESERNRSKERLRQGVNRQAPYGYPDWQMRISKEHGLAATLRSRGRPAKR